ncbi:hypothetical protein ES708_23822 [subsurface metagenome]
MTIDKAIEILTSIHDTPPSGASQDFRDSIKLGIEALKSIETWRRFAIPDSVNLLPGETKD